MTPILTERLILRDWRPDDRPAFAAMNADPEVMAFLRGPISTADADGMIDRFAAEIEREGFGIFAVEETATGRFVGMIGLHRIRPAIPIAPAVEIAWRLATEFWVAATRPRAHGRALPSASTRSACRRSSPMRRRRTRHRGG